MKTDQFLKERAYLNNIKISELDWILYLPPFTNLSIYLNLKQSNSSQLKARSTIK